MNDELAAVLLAIERISAQIGVLPALLDEVAALREAVDDLGARQLNADDVAALEQGLAAIAGVAGDAEFLLDDVLEVAAVREAFGKRSPKSIGRLCLRAGRRWYAGYRIERVGRERDGILWRLISGRKSPAARAVRLNGGIRNRKGDCR